MQRDQLRKHELSERFDRLSLERTRWQDKARYYYEDQLRYLRFLVPEGLKILEIGCGLGDQLAALKPKRGLGIDLSAVMIRRAAARHPDLEFRAIDVDELDTKETFDVILLLDVIGHLFDVESTLKKLRRFCEPHTRVIIVYYNFLWEPLLRLAERLGLKMPLDANQAVARIVFERSYERFRQLYPQLAKIAHERLAYFAYPLSGGFDRPSLVPLWSVDPLLRFEQWCRRLGRLLAFRLLVVLEKRSSV